MLFSRSHLNVTSSPVRFLEDRRVPLAYIVALEFK